MWIKHGECNNIEEYVKEQTGLSIEDVINVKNDFATPGLKSIASKLTDAVQKGLTICVVGDYDADGIDALAIWTLILRKLNAKFSLTIPKRMSEGYGMNVNMVKRFPDRSLIITVDNGIACIDAVSEAKLRGIPVIILDHHKGGDTIPDADIIVDPEYDNTGWDFDGYCGASLTFKLLQLMFPFEEELINMASAFAAIATLADSVPVLSDGRNIIKMGLKNINSRQCTPGLNALIDVIAKNDKIEVFDEETIKFKIAPIINAPGRLEDDGGKFTLSTIMCGNPQKAMEAAAKLVSLNEKRKDMVETCISENKAKGEKINWLYSPNIIEGICGIIAGKMAEDYKPSFVMTDSENGIIKGSARCKEGNNVFEMLKTVEPYLEKYGGHDYAAGFSFKKENIYAVMNGLENAAKKAEGSDNEYDFELDVKDSFNTFLIMQQLKPFGQGLEAPIIKITTYIANASVIGSEKNHIRFGLGSLKGIAFGLADKYFNELNEPKELTLYGYLEPNYYMGKMNPQFRIIDMEK